MKGKAELAIALAISVFYCILAFACYAILLPILPDGIWISESLDAFAKSSLISLLPSLVLYIALRSLRRDDVDIGVILLLIAMAVSILLYSFSRTGEDGIIIRMFVISFVIPPSVGGIASSCLAFLIPYRRK